MRGNTGNRFTALAYVGRQPGAVEPRVSWAVSCGHTHRELRLAERCSRRLKRDFTGASIIIGARWVPRPGEEDR